MKYVYGYDEAGYFTGRIEMQRNPRGEGYLVPAKSTEKEIPENMKEGQTCKYDHEIKEWHLVPDSIYVKEKLEEKDEIEICPYDLDIDGYIKNKDLVKYEAEKKEAKFQKDILNDLLLGEAISNLSNGIIYLMIAHNYSNKFNAEQITQIQSQFSDIDKLLKDKRPFHAKALIKNVPVDGVIVTEDLKKKIEALYARYL